MRDSLPGEQDSREIATPATVMLWHAEDLQAQIKPLLPGLSVEVVAHMASTNTELLHRSRSGLGPCLLVAEHQTVGRGRQGRLWQAVPGASLTFSLALTLAQPNWSGLSLAVGVALAEALDPEPRKSAALHIGLKWPNDLWLVDASGAGRKLGGILIETVNAPDKHAHDKRWVVIGVGLNVLPVYLPDLQAGAACLQEIMPGATPPLALATLALPLVQALQQFELEGFCAFAQRFARRDFLQGKLIHTTQANARTGLAQGVGSDGSLQLLTEEGRLHAIGSGEVSVGLQTLDQDRFLGTPAC
jgi:BirA family transcriptional regulator, biotin operon repressor / biotin---[acetyl-CoA-carboxylase] ligase